MRADLCACVFAFNACGCVLLVRCTDRQDTWEPPGGRCEEGEDPAAAAMREVKEETGLEVTLAGCAGVYYNTAHTRVVLSFLGAAEGTPAPSPETPDVAWMPVDAAEAAITRPSLRARWEDALALHGRRAAGYAAYRTAPWTLQRRLPSGDR